MPERVELARAREDRDAHRPALAELTVGLLPATAARLDAIARRSPELSAIEDPAERRASTSHVVANGVLTALAERGWQVDVEPGEEPRLRRGQDEVWPYKLVFDLSSGEYDETAWWDEAARLGIADIPIAPLTASLGNTPMERVTQAG